MYRLFQIEFRKQENKRYTCGSRCSYFYDLSYSAFNTRELQFGQSYFSFFHSWSCYFLDSVVCSGMADQIEKEIRSPSSRLIWTHGPHRNRVGYVWLSYRFCFMSVNHLKVCYVLENLKVRFVSLRLCFQIKLWQSLCVALYDLLRCSNWCLALY